VPRDTPKIGKVLDYSLGLKFEQFYLRYLIRFILLKISKAACPKNMPDLPRNLLPHGTKKLGICRSQVATSQWK